MVKLEDFKVGEIKKMISKYNKEVKITTSGLKKADLIKKIREHPRLTVTESDKGVNIKVISDTTIGGKKIKIKKDEKPKVPTITVTEAEKPKKKVIKKGGRYITVKPKEPKADLPPIPKSKNKIRVAPKKEEAKPLEKKLPKFKKTESLPDPSIEQLMKNIKYHKKQGNDAVVKQLEKELKMAEIKLGKMKK